MTRHVMHVVTRCEAGAGGVAVRGAVNLSREAYTGTLVVGSGGPLLDVARDAGLEVVVVPDLVSPISPSRDARAYRALREIVRARRPDIVHTHSSKAGVLGRTVAARAGVGTIVHTLHGFPWHEFQPAPVRQTYVEIERRLSRVTDTYLAVGTAVAVEVVRRRIARPDQVVTIGPAVDPPEVAATPASRARARALLGLSSTATVVGTVGRVDVQKAPEVLVAALAAMSTRATLVWVGDGPLLEQTRELARRLGLTDRILFLGNRTDVPRLLPAFDVFAMSSRYEGLPCAIVEAQQCGIPVVATAVNAVPDVVIPGVTGLLVAPLDVASLARALDHVVTHPHDAAAWVSRARALLGERYDAGALGRTLGDVYASGGVGHRTLLTAPGRSRAS